MTFDELKREDALAPLSATRYTLDDSDSKHQLVSWKWSKMIETINDFGTNIHHLQDRVQLLLNQRFPADFKPSWGDVRSALVQSLRQWAQAKVLYDSLLGYRWEWTNIPPMGEEKSFYQPIFKGTWYVVPGRVPPFWFEMILRPKTLPNRQR